MRAADWTELAAREQGQPPDPIPGEDTAPTRVARVIRVADVAAERVTWLWHGYIPQGKLSLIDGDPGDGKSTLTLDIASRVTTGTPMPDGSPTQRGSVLILSAEDGVADTIRPRLDAAGADVARAYVFDEVVEDGRARPVSLPGDLDAIAAQIARYSVRLVTIDPLMAFLGGSVDSHRDQDVRSVLHPLSKLAESTGAAFCVVRHMNKTSGGKAIYRGGGSIGIVGAARAGFVVAPDPDDDDRRIFACSKMNIAIKPKSMAYRLVTDAERDVARVQWEGTVDHHADDLMTRLDDDDRTERDEAVDFLLDLLADGPVSAVKVKSAARAADITERTLKRAKKQLKVESRKGGFDAGWVWSLPEGGHDDPKGSTPQTLDPFADGGPLRENHDAAVALLQDHLDAVVEEGAALR